MKKAMRTILGVLLPPALVTVALSGCTTDSAPAEPDFDPDAPVTIQVSNQPPETQPAQLASFQKLLAEFQDEYPNITVEGTEVGWDPATFQAQLAGGQLPTVMIVPLTEPQGLIARHQVADITSELEQVGLKDKLNPAALPIAQDADGNIYGVPVDAYALGLVYNRELFEKAGLDPDDPPATWEEVREAAKAITEKTGAVGYGQMTTGGQGGWTLTAMTYSAGGTVESPDGSAVTFTDAPKATQAQLELLHEMRWKDGSMGSQFVYDQAGVLQDFAAGKIGMVLGAPVSYSFVTQLFGMDGDLFGLGTMPQGEEAGGSLSGGALQVVMPNATPAQRLAAAKFIEFRLRYFLDEDAAIDYAKSLAETGQAVGLPGLSPLKPEYQDQYLEWVKDYINVPLDHFASYSDTINTITLTAEPAKEAQQVYAALDPVLQAVLTQEDVDIPSLLDDAKSDIETLLSR
jgi:ABC-type glycerol-3-phosphate transport system substrate-binding protein